MEADAVKLIGRRGDELYLLQRGKDGIVVDVEEVVRRRPMPVEAILRRGYWEKEPHRQDVADLLMAVPETAIVEDADTDSKDATFLATEFRALTKGVHTKIARSLIKAAHQRQYERVERDVAKGMAKFFKAQVRDTTKALFAKDWKPDPENAAAQAKRLVARAFDQDRWDEEIIAAAGQPLADAFIEGAVAEVGLTNAVKRLAAKGYNPEQPRDDNGRWGSGGSGAGGDSEKTDQTSTPEFKAWFKNSAVVDADDNPKVTNKVATVYHGTGGTFTEFDPEKVGSNGLVVGKGFYFAEDKRIADFYARTAQGGDGKVLQAYLRIEKPYDFEGIAGSGEVERLRGIAKEMYPDTFTDRKFDAELRGRADAHGSIGRQSLWNILERTTGDNDTNAVLQKAGYDGILHTSKDEYGTPARPGTTGEYGNVWIAFAPTQIKSATDNVGTFDPNDPDITKAFTKDADEEFDDEYGDDIDFPNELPDWLREAAQNYILETFEEDYWLRINITTREDIEGVLYRAIEEGMSIREIAIEIQDRCGPAYSRARATTVARTETNGSMNRGALTAMEHAYEGTDLRPTKIWLSVLGTTTRPTHEAADDQEVELNDDFTVGGERCAHPGDMRLSAGERINCLCAIISGFVGEGIYDDEEPSE